MQSRECVKKSEMGPGKNEQSMVRVGVCLPK